MHKKLTQNRTLQQQKTSHVKFQGLKHLLRLGQTVRQMLQKAILRSKQEHFRNEIQSKQIDHGKEKFDIK